MSAKIDVKILRDKENFPTIVEIIRKNRTVKATFERGVGFTLEAANYGLLPSLVDLLRLIYPTERPKALPEYIIKRPGYVTRAAAAGAGWTTEVNVPDGKIWTVFAIYADRSVGDGTLTEAWISDPRNPSGQVPLKVQSPGANMPVYPSDLAFPLPLYENYGILFQCDALTADSTWSVQIYYWEEEIF